MSWDALRAALPSHPAFWTGLALVSLATFVASLLAVPWALARLPEDYFAREARLPLEHLVHRPRLRALALLGKNLLGLLLLLLGFTLIFLPGQGLLTMFAGLLLLDFPGKYRLEQVLIRTTVLQRAANALRRRSGKPPFRLPRNQGSSS